MASSGSGTGENQGNNLWALFAILRPGGRRHSGVCREGQVFAGHLPEEPEEYAGAKVGDVVQGHGMGPGQED